MANLTKMNLIISGLEETFKLPNLFYFFYGGLKMKYENVENKSLFKNWFGISEIEIGENVELIFNDRECYDAVFEMYYSREDEKLNENSSDMELTLTHKTFENILDEYDLELSMGECLIVLN